MNPNAFSSSEASFFGKTNVFQPARTAGGGGALFKIFKSHIYKLGIEFARVRRLKERRLNRV